MPGTNKISVQVTDETGTRKMEFENGITFGELIDKITDGNTERVIRVNREAVNPNAQASDGDRVTTSPKKIEGHR